MTSELKSRCQIMFRGAFQLFAMVFLIAMALPVCACEQEVDEKDFKLFRLVAEYLFADHERKHGGLDLGFTGIADLTGKVVRADAYLNEIKKQIFDLLIDGSNPAYKFKEEYSKSTPSREIAVLDVVDFEYNWKTKEPSIEARLPYRESDCEKCCKNCASTTNYLEQFDSPRAEMIAFEFRCREVKKLVSNLKRVRKTNKN